MATHLVTFKVITDKFQVEFVNGLDGCHELTSPHKGHLERFLAVADMSHLAPRITWDPGHVSLMLDGSEAGAVLSVLPKLIVRAG